MRRNEVKVSGQFSRCRASLAHETGLDTRRKGYEGRKKLHGYVVYKSGAVRKIEDKLHFS